MKPPAFCLDFHMRILESFVCMNGLYFRHDGIRFVRATLDFTDCIAAREREPNVTPNLANYSRPAALSAARCSAVRRGRITPGGYSEPSGFGQVHHSLQVSFARARITLG